MPPRAVIASDISALRRSADDIAAALREHQVSDDPYLFDVGTDTRFLDYGYEQQASIVEEYVCCATLDPKAPRTARLKELLEGAFPLGKLTLPDKVVLPWDGAELTGICRV